ncbi:hypothetical protein J6X15_02810 [Candidatus Saccharibacteria bacterium]|nr:hypothetical protein [Candidatus Saccharibacteria bacterium]
MDVDDKKVFDEEAIAEEEFVADLEDTIENPLVYDGEKITVQEKPEPIEQKEELSGAIGTGDLTPENEPFNNENALRSENVSNDENPFGADSTSEKAFGGPDTAPLDNASETIAPSGDTTFDSASGAESTPGVTDFSTSEPAATTSTGEPTIEQLAKEAAEVPAATESTPEPASNIAPIDPPAKTADASAEPKKSKKGLIIGIVVAVLVLAAIVGGVIFYIMHESKERVLADAVSGIWSAEARQFDGKATITPNEDKNSSTIKSIDIDFKADNKSTNFSGTGGLTLNFSEGNPLKVELSGAYISGDGIFIKLGNLEETVKNLDLGAVMGVDSDSADYVKIYEDMLLAVAKKIDGTWYKINAETFGSAKEAQEGYECMTKALDEMSSKEVKNKIADIYKAHPFIVPDDKDNESADGLTYYYVKMNEDESKAFSKDVEELNVFKDMKACLSSGTGTNSGSSSSTDDEEKKDGTTSEIKLGIKGWSHELQSIKGTVKSDTATVVIDAKVGYENKDVTAPTGDTINIADAAKDLLSVAQDAFKKSYLEMAEKYCKEQSNGNQNIYNTCYNRFKAEIDTMMEDMLGGLGGDIINTSVLLQEEEE